jgi:hypothetical protein
MIEDPWQCRHRTDARIDCPNTEVMGQWVVQGIILVATESLVLNPPGLLEAVNGLVHQSVQVA